MRNDSLTKTRRGCGNFRARVAQVCFAAVLGCVMSAAGCGGAGGASATMEDEGVTTRFASTAAAMKAMTGDWRLVLLNGQSVAQTLESGGFDLARTPTLRVEPDGQMTGLAAVNRFSGTLDAERLKDGVLSFQGGGAAMTRMAGPAPLMTMEQAFIGVLNSGASVRLEGSRLELIQRDGDAGSGTQSEVAVLERAG